MSYKSCMHPKVSKGEISVFSALSIAGLTSEMVPQMPIVLRVTTLDFCWFEFKKAAYLDEFRFIKKVNNKTKTL